MEKAQTYPKPSTLAVGSEITEEVNISTIADMHRGREKQRMTCVDKLCIVMSHQIYYQFQ